MSDSPPPYSQLDDDDPFVDTPPAPVSTQPYGSQPQPLNYRVIHGYGPEIPAPEDLVRPPSGPNDKFWYVVTVGQEIIITADWGIAAAKVLHVPGAVHKHKKTWDEAVRYYTSCYRAGAVKVVPARIPSSTPGSSGDNAVNVHSAAPTPTRGDRSFPIYVSSSPITAQIHVSSSTAPTVATPTKKMDQPHSPGTIRRHKYVNKILTEMVTDSSAASSEPKPTASAWRDPTPVSIPGALQLSRLLASTGANGVEPTPPSTPRDSGTTINAGGPNGTPPSTPHKSGKGKGKAVQVDDDDSDDEYFRDMSPLTAEALESLHEWEQTWELQQALSSPRFV